MRTTLKRGVGRGATQNGGNGHATYPPSAVSSVVRYQQPPKTGKGLGIFGRILLFVLLLVVGVGLAAAGGALLWLHESISAVRAHSIDVKQAQKQLNVSRPGHAALALVIGYDKRLGTDASDISRSDTVMMIRADPATNTISMLSIPRDLGVPIYCPHSGRTSLGVQKVNQAYALCGSAGTVDTVKHFSNLPINYLITVNFHGFKEIVDKIGGIWLDIDRRYYHVNNGTAAQNYANINIQPGYQLVDGENALDFVRYRHTDDDYHRIARQQEFVRALKQQFAHKFSFTELPSIVSTLTKNVEVGGNPSDKTVLSWLLFGMTLPGGHFFQDRIQGVTGDSMTSTATANIQSALHQFTHPDTGSSKVANAAALGVKVKPKVPPAPAPSKTSVLVLNGNGVAGSAADGAYLLRQRGYVTVLPPRNASPNAPTQGYFPTTIYYDKRQQGSKAAATAISTWFVPSAVGPLPRIRSCALDPGRCYTVVVGRRSTTSSSRRPRRRPPKQASCPTSATTAPRGSTS
jgi:LCP family protein required for cell wall assembly